MFHKKTNLVGDFYAFRNFDEIGEKIESVYRSALNVVKQTYGKGMCTSDVLLNNFKHLCLVTLLFQYCALLVLNFNPCVDL